MQAKPDHVNIFNITPDEGLAVHHRMVRRQMQDLFDAINRGDAAPVLAAFCTDAKHVVIGEPALSGAESVRPRWRPGISDFSG